MRPAMITGCNTNVLYRGKQFHVQTEDSGRGKPHIISHVYHGGTIIASEKSSYAHRVDAEELEDDRLHEAAGALHEAGLRLRALDRPRGLDGAELHAARTLEAQGVVHGLHTLLLQRAEHPPGAIPGALPPVGQTVPLEFLWIPAPGHGRQPDLLQWATARRSGIDRG